MQEALTLFTEALSDDELEYLQQRLRKQRHGFFKTLKVAFVICIAMPSILGALLYASMHYAAAHPRVEKMEVLTDLQILALCLATLGVIAIIMCIAFALAYYFTVYDIHRDINGQFKVVERVVVAEKRYMRLNNTYHFYLAEASKLSVEVSAEDFENYLEGDEINLEYTPNAKIDLGYF